MKKIDKSLWTLALFAMLIAILPTVAGAASRSAIADFGIGGDGVVWVPRLTGLDRLILTVTGPEDLIVRREFAAGESPTLGLFDQAGFPLADGLYKYELVAVPRVDAATRERMAAARESGDDSIVAALRREGLLPAETSRQAGSFAIRGGAFVPPDLREPAAGAAAAPGPDALTSSPGPQPDFATVLTGADGVIRNSLCVGFDCPNSPSFSDTTILMMENNTRIKFDDTSSTASFPNNDWEIEANSNLNGGANYLGFNDCGNSSQGGCATDLVFAVESGVRASALYVESDGDVGFGTSNPVVNLHVVDGNTPTLRLEQDGSGGFTPQTWDVAGNETNFFIRDATGGSALPFRIQPGAGSNSLFIASDEEVGVGTSSPDAPLHVFRSSSIGTDGQLHVENTNGTVADRNMIRVENNGPPTLFFANTNAAANGNWTYTVTAGGVFQINAAGSGAPIEAQLSAGGNLTIGGTITTAGSCSIGCDEVFSPDYELETIEEHADRMWQSSFLPAVGPTPAGTAFNLTQKTEGILNELEKAHIYIDQLNRDLKQKNAELESVNQRLARLEAQLLGE